MNDPLQGGEPVQPPPEQHLKRVPPFTHFEVQKHPNPNMLMLVVVDRVSNEISSYPMAVAYAAELGKELSAPRVEVPSNGVVVP